MGKEQDLLEAARSGNVVAIEKLTGNRNRKGGGISSLSLSSLRRAANVNYADGNGDTALHLAALAGHKEAVELLLHHEASPCLCDDKGCTPLHMAAWTGSAEVCHLLLSQNPSSLINVQNSEGDTALHCAAQYGHTNAVAALVEADADPMIRNLREESPLDLAAQYGREDVVHLLITRHPSLAFHVHQKHSPLHLASRYGHPAVVNLLLSSGFEVGLKTSHGTALHEACCYCKEEVIRILLEKGVIVDEGDGEGKTAVDILAALNTQKALDMIKFITEETKDSSAVQTSNTLSSLNPTGPANSSSPSKTSNSSKTLHSTKAHSSSISKPEHSFKTEHSLPDLPGDPTSSLYSTLPSPKQPSSNLTSSNSSSYTTPLTILVGDGSGEPEYVSPEGKFVDDPKNPIYAIPNKQKKPAVAPPLPPRNSIQTISASPPKTAELTVDVTENPSAYMEMGFRNSEPPKVSPGKPPRKKTPRSETWAESQVSVDQSKPTTVIQTDVLETVTSNDSTVYEQMTGGSKPKVLESLYDNLLNSADATLTSIQNSLGKDLNKETIKHTEDSGKEKSKTEAFIEENDSKGENSATLKNSMTDTKAETANQKDSMGSGRGSRPPSLEFDHGRNRLLSQELPLTPTGYPQPPTPDHPPPSPHTAVKGIHERINPMDKRKSRDIETLTEPLFLGGIPEKDPEMEESELEGRIQDEFENHRGKLTGDSNVTTVPILQTTTTTSSATVTSSIDSNDDNNTSSSQSFSQSTQHVNNMNNSESSAEPTTENNSAGNDSVMSTNDAITDSDVTEMRTESQSPSVNGVVLRRKSDTMEKPTDSVNNQSEKEVEPFSGLLKGSQPGGSRNVVSQIYQNVVIRRPKSRGKRLSAPSTIVTFDPLMEREDEINAEKFMEAIDQAIADGTGETSHTVEESNFDDSEEWAKISAIVSSYGGRLSMANRDSIFFEREMEKILSLADAGKLLSVADWLEGVGLRQYENTLVAHGFDDVDFLGGGILQVEDLKQIGIDNEDHRRRIKEAADLLLPIVPIGSTSMPSSVEDWLASLRLSEYWHTFKSHGYTSMDRVRKLWQLELATVLDITNLGHRKRLLASLGDRPIEKSDKLTVDVSDWKKCSMDPEPPKPQPSPIEGLDFYKDYTNVKPKSGEGKVSASGKTHTALQFDSSEDEDSMKPLGHSLRDNTLHIRPPHMAHTTSPVTQWRHCPEKLIKGCCNYVAQYLGSSLVKQLNGIDSTREGMTKMKLRFRKKFQNSADGLAKIPMIMLSISYKGVKFIDAKSKRVVCEHEIGNIFCACQDPETLNFFAYITKDRETSKHYCHVFSVNRTDLATEIILTLGEAFEIAYQVALKEKAEEEASEFERKLGQSSDADDGTSQSSKTSLNTI